MKLMIQIGSSEDISIYLTLFERQISRIEITKENWVEYLLNLCPLEIVHFLAPVHNNLANDYEHIRKFLLKQFN